MSTSTNQRPASRVPLRTSAIQLPSSLHRPRRSMRFMRAFHAWRPGMAPLLLGFLVIVGISMSMVSPGRGVLGWTLTVIWSLPALPGLVGLSGVLKLRRRSPRDDFQMPPHLDRADAVIVLVPTIGRRDTYPALDRSVRSFANHLPSHIAKFRIDILTEEGCETADEIEALAASLPRTRVITVPRSYRTANGTRFKARANEYANQMRRLEGESRDNVWVLHMDDDTALGQDTASALARFINRQRIAGADALHLGQGILTYPRENAVNRFTWLADSVRPADDFSRFRALTGSGTPIGGLHGELLLIRASVEAEIGWDFGPKSIVEDAQFALTFCARYPNRSGWFNGRCLGASPASVRDFLKQRERWCWGLLELVFRRSIPLRHRVFLAVCLLPWVIGPAQHIATVGAICILFGLHNAEPVWRPALLLWGFNLAYVVWMYWEGLRMNALSSERSRRYWYEPILVILYIPAFAMLEGVGGARGLYKALRRKDSTFTVIAKPA